MQVRPVPHPAPVPLCRRLGDPRAGLDSMQTRRMCAPAGDTVLIAVNERVAQSLYWPSYPIIITEMKRTAGVVLYLGAPVFTPRPDILTDDNCGFPQSIQKYCSTVHEDRWTALPATSLAIHHSLNILSFDTIYCKIKNKGSINFTSLFTYVAGYSN
jgi:hypothetical protein